MARRSDHTREELTELTLEAALNIVKKDGATALTARNLAKEIGYTPGTLYNMFGSMDGLLYEINKETLFKINETIATDETSSSPPKIRKILNQMAENYINFAHKNRELWLLLFDTPSNQKPPKWYLESIENSFRPLETIIAPLYKSNKELELAARTLWASIHGICYLEITKKGSMRKSKQNAIEHAEYVIKTYINAAKK